MYKIGVMGDKDSVYGFLSVGLSVFPVENGAQGSRILHQIADEYAVVFITEQLAGEMEAEIEKYKERTTPAIVPIPGIRGNTGIGLKSVSKTVEQAVGSDILPE